MDEINLKALAKINLSLDVVRRREDGYHEVRMIMQTINLYDKLEIKKSKEPGIQITTNSSFLPTNENNLVYKAADLLKKGVFTSREEVEAMIEELNSFQTEEVRIPYLSFAEEMLNQCKMQEELAQTEGEPSFSTRREFGDYLFNILEKKSVCSNVFIDSFAVWYQKLQTRYTVVYGKQYSIEEADKAYYKLVDHARLYQKNILEVEAPVGKKSLFASLKSGISNAIYKNYEANYSSISCHYFSPRNFVCVGLARARDCRENCRETSVAKGEETA
mgnify:CR=1 FL=1